MVFFVHFNLLTKTGIKFNEAKVQRDPAPAGDNSQSRAFLVAGRGGIG